MIVFRQADPRYPFLWSDSSQPAGRWHGAGSRALFRRHAGRRLGQLLRHEEISDPADAATIRRALWAVEIGDEPADDVSLPTTVARGQHTYTVCQGHARDLRAGGGQRIVAPSAALVLEGATGRRVVAGAERPAASRSGRVIVLFGQPERLVGWKAVEHGAPPAELLPRVRHLSAK